METGWNGCPPEILRTIFDYLNIPTLSICMRVNTKWKAIVEQMVEQYNLWELIVKTEISNGGVAFKQKTRLNWQKIYRNSLLWNYVKTADIILLHTYELQNVEKINVSDGELILINDSSTFYYDISTYQQFAEIKSKYLEESENLVAELIPKDDDIKELHVYAKTKVNQQNIFTKIIYLADIRLINLDANSCYILSKGNVLSLLEFSQEKCCIQFLGRCYTSDYDPIINIYIWNDLLVCCGKCVVFPSVYLTTKHGIVWRYNFPVDKRVTDLVIHKVYEYPVPPNISSHDWVMFGKLKSVIPVTSNENGERVVIQYEQCFDSTVLKCAGLTSTVPHDNVLLLGYSDGTVEIRLSKKNTENSPYLARSFNIKQFSNDDDSDLAVVTLNVYEVEDSHILFVGTRKRVFQILIAYSDNVLNSV